MTKGERVAEVKEEYTARRGDIYLGYKRERQPILVANVHKSDAEFEKAIAPLEAEFHNALNEADDELRAKIRADLAHAIDEVVFLAPVRRFIDRVFDRIWPEK